MIDTSSSKPGILLKPAGAVVPNRALLILGSYIVASGLVSLAGWAADIPRLTDWDSDQISIQPNAALAATAAGISVLLLAAGRGRLAMLSAAVVAAIGGATIVQYLTGLDLGIDTALMFDRPWGRQGTLIPGRMGPPGSISWTLIGTALLCLNGGSRLRRGASILALVTISLAALSLTGYLFGADRLYTIPTLTVIALQTATMTLASGFAILYALPEQQPIRRLREESAAGLLTRRLFPLVLAVPLVLGFLQLRGQSAGLYDTAMGTAILVLLLIAFLFVVVWRGASAVREYELRLETQSAKSRASIAASEERYRSWYPS